MIYPFDDVMSEDKNNEIYNFLLNETQYSYGERDRPHHTPVGMVVAHASAADIHHIQLLLITLALVFYQICHQR